MNLKALEQSQKQETLGRFLNQISLKWLNLYLEITVFNLIDKLWEQISETTFGYNFTPTYTVIFIDHVESDSTFGEI